MRNRTILTSLLTAALLVSTPLVADTQSAQMNVSVTVVARAQVTVDDEPEVVITDADVARGYVEVTRPMRLRVRTNSPRGYLLQVAKTDETFAAVELAFDNTTMTVAQESWIARPPVEGGELVSVKLRVRLASDATPGRYGMPVQVSALPL